VLYCVTDNKQKADVVSIGALSAYAENHAAATNLTGEYHMFAELSSFVSPKRSKRSPMLADFLRFNSKQSKHYDLGHAGEKLAIAMLQDAGFKAYKTGERNEGDIHAKCPKTGQLFRVEVKTASRSEARKNWQFCLNKPMHTSTSHSDYILLICVAEKDVFTYLIPSSFLAGISQFCITSHPTKYKGKAAPFRTRGSLSFQAACNVYELAMLQ
jgi:uncharacterized C2H2 Zn-finger protein